MKNEKCRMTPRDYGTMVFVGPVPSDEIFESARVVSLGDSGSVVFVVNFDDDAEMENRDMSAYYIPGSSTIQDAINVMCEWFGVPEDEWEFPDSM